MGVRGSRQKQGCKAPSYLCRPTQLRFVAARGNLFAMSKSMECKAHLLVVRLPPSLKLWRDKQLRKLACRTGGFVCHAKSFIVLPNSISFRCGTGGGIAPFFIVLPINQLFCRTLFLPVGENRKGDCLFMFKIGDNWHVVRSFVNDFTGEKFCAERN